MTTLLDSAKFFLGSGTAADFHAAGFFDFESGQFGGQLHPPIDEIGRWHGNRRPSGRFPRWSRSMLPNVVSVTQTGPYRLRVRFDDGAEGEIDVKAAVPFTGVFEPLADPAFFAQVRVDPDAGTVVWPNGADLDTLVLHSRVTGRPVTLDLPSEQAG